MKHARPSDDDLYNASLTGDWSGCEGAVPEDMLRPLFADHPKCNGLPDESATTIYHVFESQRLRKVPRRLLTQEALDSLWDSPTYSPKIMREFDVCAELGKWDFIEEMLYTEVNASRPIDEFGNTCLHVAARFGQLHTVPQQMLTLKALSIANAAGLYPLNAIQSQEIDFLAERLSKGDYPAEMLEKVKSACPDLWLLMTKGQQLSHASTIDDL